MSFRGEHDGGPGMERRGMTARLQTPAEPSPKRLDLGEAARAEVATVMRQLGTSSAGLDSQEAAARLRTFGPNAILSHGARPFEVLTRQLRNPLLLLLGAATIVSAVVGQRTDAAIILAIVALSVGLGFANEYRSERAIEELHSKIRHAAIAIRDGRAVSVDVTELVPGDVVRLDVGDIVPADLRLLEADGLECDEAVLTGESLPSSKSVDPVPEDASALDLSSCAFRGTVVRNGDGLGVVVETGRRTEFGRIARELGERPAETAFQLGLRDFSKLLVRVTAALTVAIFVINALLRRPLLDAALFALAIAVGLTPQLLPAIVTISLSTGARRLSRKKVVVKRLVSIEDLGNIEVLFTDKTGTLTEGRTSFTGALDPTGHPSADSLLFGLLCNAAVVQDGAVVGGNPLDRALWESPEADRAQIGGYRRLGERPFDYDRKLMSVLVEGTDGRQRLVVKGAPEFVLARSGGGDPKAQATLDRLYAAGARVVAVATKDAAGLDAIRSQDEDGLTLSGFLTFADPPKAEAANPFAACRSSASTSALSPATTIAWPGRCARTSG